MNTFTQVIIGMLMLILVPQTVYAESQPVAGESARPLQAVEIVDARARRLKAFLQTYDSPMTSDAEHFVAEADRLSLDWKLVAAIAGVESTFGRHVPRNSYNGWGWGIFTGASDGIHFASWADGITTVSEGLKNNYVAKGATSIEQIGRIYAASPTWSAKVRFFMQKLDEFEPSGAAHLEVTI